MSYLLKRPLAVFDIESSGLDQKNDKILELSIYKENPDHTCEEFYSVFNPGDVPISPDATKVNGFTKEKLKDAPFFSEKANEIIEFIKGCDLGGYNVIHFDIPMLFEEFQRVGITYNFKKHTIWDAYKIWTMSENRTLSGAVKRYLGKEHIHAHSAVDDVMMTSQIIKKQIEEYVTKGEMYESPEQMAIITSEMNKRVDLSGKFVYNENGAVVISFGKHKNKTILEVYHEDPSYFLWMSGKADFPTDTKLIAKQIYEKLQLVK